MIRSALLLSLALLGLTAFDASAAEVRVAYRGEVADVYGAHASSFVVGQPLTLSYVVDTSVVDSDPTPNTGLYWESIREMRVGVPGAGLDAFTQSGTVNIWNDLTADPFDNATFFGHYPSGLLAGLPITFINLSFSDYNAGPGGNPLMLVDDSIPTKHLLVLNSNVSFYTSAGWTTIRFAAAADEPSETCTSEGYKGTQLIWCKNICENGLSGKVLDTWIHRWVNRYRQLPYCAVDGPSNPT